MRVKEKVLLILVNIFVLFGILVFGVQRFVILPSFLELEREEAQKDLQRCTLAIQREIQHLDTLCHDWATWDDTYRFVQSPYEAYIEANLVYEVFPNNQLNLIYIIDRSNRIAWSGIYDLKSEKPLPLSEFSPDFFPSNHPLASYDDQEHSLENQRTNGILMTEAGAMLISSRPILQSDNQGPIRGSFMMGRFFNEELIEKLAEQTRVEFRVLAKGKDPVPEDVERLLNPSATETRLIREADSDYLSAYTALNDIFGKPAILIGAKIPRKISSKGIATLWYALLSIVLTGVVALSLLIWLLQRTVLKPITLLTHHALSVEKSGDLSARISLNRPDEIGDLARVLDRLMDRLAVTIQELKDSEEMYRMITEHSLAQITLVRNGRIIFANPRVMEASGYSLDEIRKLDLWQILHPDDRKIIQQRSAARLAGEQRVNHYEFRYLTKNREVRWLEQLTIPIVYKGEKAALGHAIDITEKKEAQAERKALEGRLQRAEKMEALGLLAGGVAHDLNNILSGIVSYPELLMLDLPEGSPLRRPLLTIQQSGQKAAAVVQDLLTLARRGVTVTEVVNLNEVIRNYLGSPEFENTASLNPDAKVEVYLNEHMLHTEASPVHLQKCIMNLVSNAMEAMPAGGVVTISTDNRYVDASIRGFGAVEEGDYVVLTISDTGIGLSDEDAEKIFEPFYTKKVMGRSGSGLGMSVVWATVQDHKGYIDLQSREGEGTVITLYFPATRRTRAGVRDVVPIERYMGKGERILVADDEQTQKDIASGMLSKLGYRVSTVSSGEAALAFLKAHSADLVVLDMIMNGDMDGLDTYRKMIAQRPNQKAIIASGFSETDRVLEAQRLGAGAYIRKPYSLESLGMAVRRELDRK